jgi:hypothetical protein
MSRESRDRSLRELMDGHGVGALLLSSPANFAWYTGGADNRVDHGDPVGVASVLLTMDDAYILTNNIEAPRMREEQTPQMEVVEHPWYEEPAALLRELAGGAGVGTDFPFTSGPDLSAEISPLRYVLDPDAIDLYRDLGEDTVVAVSEAAASVSPDTDELDAAAQLSAACLGRGMFAPVLLAASEERLVRHRHPVPHGGALGKQAKPYAYDLLPRSRSTDCQAPGSLRRGPAPHEGGDDPRGKYAGPGIRGLPPLLRRGRLPRRLEGSPPGRYDRLRFAGDHSDARDTAGGESWPGIRLEPFARGRQGRGDVRSRSRRSRGFGLLVSNLQRLYRTVSSSV